MIKQYTTVPEVVEAVQFDGTNGNEICEWSGGHVQDLFGSGDLWLHKSGLAANICLGAWVVKYGKNSFERVADADFKNLFREVQP